VNGLFGLWIPACAFPIWKFAMIYVLMKAVKSEEREALEEQRQAGLVTAGVTT
jgi:hypothetical protein